MPTLRLCADFILFPDNTAMPTNFVLSSFLFHDNGTGQPWFVNDTAGERGLQFDTAGASIKLPAPTDKVDLRIGTFAGQVQISAEDQAGTAVAQVTVPGTNSYHDVTISGVHIARLVLAGGGYEGILRSVCMDVSICD
jgi:hypothetical protein